MPSFKVELADGPTRVMSYLVGGAAPWHRLRDDIGATSADMNLLVDLGLIEYWSDPYVWELTDEGRAAIKTSPSSQGSVGAGTLTSTPAKETVVPSGQEQP